jgi:hypothetical protein
MFTCYEPCKSSVQLSLWWGGRDLPARKCRRQEGRPAATRGPAAREGRRGGGEDAGDGGSGKNPQRRKRKRGLAGQQDDTREEEHQSRKGAQGASEEAAQRPGSSNAGSRRRRHRVGFARRLMPAAARGLVEGWRRRCGARVPPESLQRERRGGFFSRPRWAENHLVMKPAAVMQSRLVHRIQLFPLGSLLQAVTLC